MVLQCYTWILHFLKQIRGDCDDNIAAEDICRKVYKKWQMLTSSSNCRWHHQSRDRPLILRYYSTIYFKFSIIDEKFKECKVTVLEELKHTYFVSCCSGLVLLSTSFGYPYFVLNPLSEEITKIDAPSYKVVPYGSFPCGFFFHPLAKEYRILFVLKKGTHCEYYLYLFGAKKWRRTANPYFHCQPEDYWGCPKWINSNPAIVNGALHWYIGHEIMVFHMISEEFSVKPLPFEKGYYRGKGFEMRDLLVKEDCLCFFHVGCQESVMDIWILEDYANWSWVRKFIVNVDWNMKKYPVEVFKGFEERLSRCEKKLNLLRVVSIHKDELLLFWRRRGMFSYHLGFHTVKKIRLKKSEVETYFYSDDWNWGFRVYLARTSDS